MAEQDPWAREANERTGAESGSAVDQTKEKAGEVAGQAKEKTGQLLSQATEQAKPRLESSKEQAAESISSAAQALRQSGGQLREQQQGAVAQVAETAADQVERMADFLRGRDVDQLVQEVEGFARSKPYVFLGAAGALGLVAGRFLKSSGGKAPQTQSSEQGEFMPGRLARPPFVEEPVSTITTTATTPYEPEEDLWTRDVPPPHIVPPEREVP